MEICVYVCPYYSTYILPLLMLHVVVASSKEPAYMTHFAKMCQTHLGEMDYIYKEAYFMFHLSLVHSLMSVCNVGH